MYICMKDNLPPTNRQQHGRATRDGGRKKGGGGGGVDGEKEKKAERGEWDGEKCSSLLSEIEIPAAEEVGGKVCERERETLTSNPPSLWLCLYSAGRKITRAHTCFNTLSAEGIEKRDTLNIKALVNTDEESVLLQLCVHVCVYAVCARSTLVQQKFLGCSRNAHQIQHASLNHKKKRRKVGRGEDEIVLQKDLSCFFHLCVCVSLYFTEA